MAVPGLGGAGGAAPQMAGQQTAMPPPGGAPGAMPDGQQGGERRATEEEKTVFAELMGNALNVIYESKTADSIADALRRASQAGDPSLAVEPLAQVVSAAVTRVAHDGIEQGIPIDREMAGAAAAMLAADLGTNLAQSAGAEPLSKDQVQAVYLRSMEILAEQKDHTELSAGEGGQDQQGQPAPGPRGAGNGLAPNRRTRRQLASAMRRQG